MKPGTPIELRGQSYILCVDLEALADSELYFRKYDDGNLNLVASLAQMNTEPGALFHVAACALHTYHPELPLATIGDLIGIRHIDRLRSALVKCDWGLASEETEKANLSLHLDLDAIVDGAEHFARRGERVPVTTLSDGLTLAAVRSIYPCMLHHARPELSFPQCQSLMNLQSVFMTAIGFSNAWRDASAATRERYSRHMSGADLWPPMASA